MNKQDNTKGLFQEKLKKILAEHIGVETEDIDEDDHLKEDLHMNPADLTDLVEKLKNSGFDTSVLELSEIETVADLIDSVGLDEDLN